MTEEAKTLKDLPGYDACGQHVFEFEGEPWVEPEKEKEVHVEEVITEESLKPEEASAVFEGMKGVEERCGVGMLKELLGPDEMSLEEMQHEITVLQNEVLSMLEKEQPVVQETVADNKMLQQKISELKATVGSEGKPSQTLVNIVSKLEQRTALLQEPTLRMTLERVRKATAAMDEVIKLGKTTDLQASVGNGEELNKLLEELRSRDSASDPLQNIIERLATLRPIHDACDATTSLVREATALQDATDTSLQQSLGTLLALEEDLPKLSNQISANTLAIQARADRLSKNLKLLEDSKK